MLKIFNLIILLSIVSSTNGHCADNKTPALQEGDPNWYSYPTKFGDVKFFDDKGKLGSLATSITLNDKTLINVKGEKDAQGSFLYLMEEITKLGAIEYEPRIAGQSGRRKIRRMIVLVGPVANCVKHFVILDFTGKQAFVSERFGDNPTDTHCLSFERAKWGKLQSSIRLEGPITYANYTGGKVIDSD